MTSTLDTPTNPSNNPGNNPSDTPASDVVLSAGKVNARCEQVYLKGEGFQLSARQIVYCLAAHLSYFGDTLDPKIVDPLCAIDAHMRFDGDLTGWAHGATPNRVALLLARAEQIARNYFGAAFPVLTW